MCKFKAEVRKFEKGLWSFHLIVPESVYMEMSREGTKRVMCSLNNEKAFHAGFMPDGKGNWFIKLNKEKMKIYKLELGQEVDVSLSKDNSKYGMALPEEFEELLYQDPEGEKYFDALSPGKRRSLIYMVDQVKSSDIRLRRALVILQFLKQNQGELDYRQLNEAIKNSNQDLDAFFR